MPSLTGPDIRKTFIDFFKSKQHTFVPSSSLVPGSDQTLLFTNAGMVQFKDIFLGIDKRPYKRAVNSQKCMRVAGKHNDLEDVGKDGTHHTFFEMLGNWSFGDYYKKDAITWAWELLTNVWKMDKSLLWVTCFKDEKEEIPTDLEAADTWREQPGLNPDHIVFLGRKENFWEMAETGPCGPCSEIYIDLGEKACNKKKEPGHECSIGHDCQRFLEFWNLVFIQYNRINPTELIPLPARHVDTGMGLDRIVSILQKKKTNYETDLFLPLMDEIMRLCKQNEKERDQNPIPYRVIADHCRAATFLIADGVVPGNIGRNYICRMIIRRAARFGGKLGLNQPFLADVAKKVIENYGSAHPELEKNKKMILDNLIREEVRFKSTIEIGQAHLQTELNLLVQQNKKILSGNIAFDLYATHGLPLEITRDIAREQGLDVEEKGFIDAMESHRINSGAGKIFGHMGGENSEMYSKILDSLMDNGKLKSGEISYDPYSTTQIDGELLAILEKGENVEIVACGAKVEVVIPSTCFYIESGGQVSDTGRIFSKDNKWIIRIDDVQKPAAGLIVHNGEVIKGTPRIGDAVVAMVDVERRRNIMRNHTATHLLHAKLREILGDHVRQAGSLVAPDRLRFDFTHPSAVSSEELDRVEEAVNKLILSDYQLHIELKSREEAISEGAIALFGEKYGESVRTVSIGDEDLYSYELCGGTHVDQTAIIGTFIITNETSVAAGIRRIEAITGEASYSYLHKNKLILDGIAKKLSASIEELPNRVQTIIDINEEYKKAIEKSALKSIDEQFQKNKERDLFIKNDVYIYISLVDQGNADSLRSLADKFRVEYKSGIIALGAIDDKTNRALILIAITDNLIRSKGLDAVDIIKEAGKVINGGGGGKPNLAQAGGSDTSRLKEALQKIRMIVEDKI